MKRKIKDADVARCIGYLEEAGSLPAALDAAKRDGFYVSGSTWKVAQYQLSLRRSRSASG